MKIFKLFCLLLFAMLTCGVVSAQSFTNVAPLAGLDHRAEQYNLMGGGVAVSDIDDDGDIDVMFTTCNKDSSFILYGNNGDGTFTDITASSGIKSFTDGFYTMGMLPADFDNDGYPDLLITIVGEMDGAAGPPFFFPAQNGLLLHNNGDGTFTDITSSSGINNTSWGVCASVADINNDGYLDIHIANYVDTSRFFFGVHPVTGDSTDIFNHYCPKDELYINNGDLTFTEMGDTYMPLPGDTGCGLTNLFTDYDNDGDMDIMVGNDFGDFIIPNYLWRNDLETSNQFTEVSVAANADDSLYSMGIAVGDYDRDLDLDYYITSIGQNVLLQNDGDGVSSPTNQNT